MLLFAGPFRILRAYAEADTLNFTELCNQASYPSDLGGYYIRQLVKDGFLKKTAHGQYTITALGKSYLAANLENTHQNILPRLILLFIARQHTSYITLRRQRQPYIGRLEWNGGKVRLGESIEHAKERILTERFGAVAPNILVGFFRRIDMFEEAVFDDKLFAVHEVDFSAVNLSLASNTQGQLISLSEHQLLSAEKLARSLLDILQWSKDDHHPVYIEHTYQLNSEDLMQPDALK